MVDNISRYVAIGDSFTEGLWDPRPENPDVQRGWADRLAESLSARRRAVGLAPLEYANHAIRGKLLDPILTDQLPLALDQKPDLISIIGGGNDLLRPGVNPDALAVKLERAVIAARQSGARVLMSASMDTEGLPLLGAIGDKVARYNSHIWSIAHRQGAAVLDLWGLHALRSWHMWSQDRIHLSPLGHHRVAQAALFALGLTPDDSQWRTPLPMESFDRLEQLKEDSLWLRRDVVPWATRRFRRSSSGDTRVPKDSRLRPI